MNCLDEIKFEGNDHVLTEAQKQMAFSMAQLKLISDPQVANRLRQLQIEATIEVKNMVKSRNGLPTGK